MRSDLLKGVRSRRERNGRRIEFMIWVERRSHHSRSSFPQVRSGYNPSDTSLRDVAPKRLTNVGVFPRAKREHPFCATTMRYPCQSIESQGWWHFLSWNMGLEGVSPTQAAHSRITAFRTHIGITLRSLQAAIQSRGLRTRNRGLAEAEDTPVGLSNASRSDVKCRPEASSEHQNSQDFPGQQSTPDPGTHPCAQVKSQLSHLSGSPKKPSRLDALP